MWLPWVLLLAAGAQTQGGSREEAGTSACVLLSTAPSRPPASANPAFPFPVTTADLELSGMRTLEHVAVTVTITHPRRGNLEIRLFCPSGMMSLIGTTRSMDS